MNLKESFRYQRFLDQTMTDANYYIREESHNLKVIKTHMRSKVNPEAEDIVEVPENKDSFTCDDVLAFMKFLVAERGKLSTAIGTAKANLEFDLDAAIEANKFRQTAKNAIRCMIAHRASKTIESGSNFKFNAEGNQILYYYDVMVEKEENYNKAEAKKLMYSLIGEADRVSNEIDAALVNTIIDYDVPFDVNESFQDIMEAFAKKLH